MYKNADLNVYVPFISMGALLLAAVYQTLLAGLARQRLLLYYATYLWCVFFSIFLRCFWMEDPYQFYPRGPYVVTVSLVWVGNIIYIYFVGHAVRIRKVKTPIAYFFWKWAWLGILGLWIPLQFARIFLPKQVVLQNLLFYCLSIFTLTLSLHLIFSVYRRHRDTFIRVLLMGALGMLVFFTLALVSIGSLETIWSVKSFTFICLGYLVEMAFFSYAVQIRATERMKVQKQWLNRKSSAKSFTKKTGSLTKMAPVDGVLSKTDQDLLHKLVDFEKDPSQFTRKDISLASLSGQFNTNTVYLSSLINANRSKNFTSWLNELRIRHLMERLNSDPHYRLYKISYLAEATGFSAQSTFIKAFKQAAGCSPSEYIHSLPGENPTQN